MLPLQSCGSEGWSCRVELCWAWWSGLVHRRGTRARECVLRLLVVCARQCSSCVLLACVFSCVLASCRFCRLFECLHGHLLPAVATAVSFIVPHPLPPYGTIGRESCAPTLGCGTCYACYANSPRALACLPRCATECCATHSRENMCDHV